MNHNPDDSRGGLCLATLIIVSIGILLTIGGGAWLMNLFK